MKTVHMYARCPIRSSSKFDITAQASAGVNNDEGGSEHLRRGSKKVLKVELFYQRECVHGTSKLSVPSIYLRNQLVLELFLFSSVHSLQRIALSEKSWYRA